MRGRAVRRELIESVPALLRTKKPGACSLTGGATGSSSVYVHTSTVMLNKKQPDSMCMQAVEEECIQMTCEDVGISKSKNIEKNKTMATRRETTMRIMFRKTALISVDMS